MPKKRDFILILGLVLLACVFLGVGLRQRGRLAFPGAQSAERTAAPMQAAEETGASPADGSNSVQAAVASYFDEYPAESYLVLTTRSGIHSPVPLNEENEFRITQPDGSENVVHIGHNSFYMASSNCENQNCVQQGEVTMENRDTRVLFNMVICLPHNLSLQLISREEAQSLLTELYAQAEAGTAEAPFGTDGDAQ